jgi:hypothetical protein
MNTEYSALLTDLYQLTMLQGYSQHEMHETAVFEFFVRKLPTQRNFLLAAGLEQAITYLEELAFSPAEIEWLAATQRFQPAFVRWLENLHFTGDVDAMPEGTVFFFCRRTDPASNCAATAGAIRRNAYYQPTQLSNGRSLESGTLSAGRTGKGAGRFRVAPRTWRRGGNHGGARNLYRRVQRHIKRPRRPTL